jgi:hypothetical protein
MSIEALWAVRFAGAHGVRVATSTGVIILETGRIFGGDSWTFYTGRYERNANGTYKVSIQTGVYNNEGGLDIFGGPLQARKLSGEIRVADDQRTMAGTVTVDGVPQMVITATLTRVAELP